jgi:hypothetical protein
MSRSRIRAFEQDIFRILLKSHPERIARVASVALYWCQLAQHRHHGKLGIFKTDSDLGEDIGRHGKTAGKNLMEVCTPLGQDCRTALFEVTYGPKAGQDCGRCRWLFLTPRGEQIIQLAHEDRAMRAEVTPLMHARVRMLRALNRHVERVFNLDGPSLGTAEAGAGSIRGSHGGKSSS